MTELTIKLVIILIPGAIATLIFGKLILHKEWSNFRFILYSILFGLFSYLTLQGVIEIINLLKCKEIKDLTIWTSLSDSKLIPYTEVFFASVMSLLLAFLIAWIENKKLVFKVAKFIGVSNKFGDENLFSRYLNEPETEVIYLRDIDKNLTYHGWVKSFSENDKICEIRLADVSVYSYDESDLLYEVDEIYISLSNDQVRIEKAILKEND